MNPILTCIAIDDEPLALSIIRTHADKVPFINLKATFNSAAEALAYLEQESISLVFLDINMPDISGIELAKMINPEIKIIFTTAYPEYAVDGFELAATDFLLKPIGFSRFFKACTRVQEQLATKPEPIKSEGHIFIKDGYSLVRVNFDDLIYVQADDNYLTFYEANKKILARMTLKEALEKLPEKQFLRVHKSYIVSRSKIEKIERHQIIVSGTAIPVSPTYRQELLEYVATA
jgi:two-component system, LytTR family, response regulator